MFYKSVWYIAESICDFFNMFLIPKLVLYNFETDVMPQMKVRNIGQARDMQQGAAALANLFHNNILTPDIDTEQYVRKLFDIPLKKSKVQTPILPPSPFGDGGSAPASKGSRTQQQISLLMVDRAIQRKVRHKHNACHMLSGRHHHALWESLTVSSTRTQGHLGIVAILLERKHSLRCVHYTQRRVGK